MPGSDQSLRVPVDGNPLGSPIHATAVAIGGCGLLILGPSGSGKSHLASTLIASAPRGIRLVGDDRILLALQDGGLVARPHPRIAGFIERRGLGIVACAFVPAAVVRGIVHLYLTSSERGGGPTTLPTRLEENFSALPAVLIDGTARPEAQCDAVLSWWRDARTTPVIKTPRNASRGVKV